MKYPAYPSYKVTDTNWLTQVPQSWDVRPLKYCCDFLNNRRIPLSSIERTGMPQNYPYYGASGIIDYVEEYIYDEPTILIAEDGANLLSRSTNLAFVATGKYWVNNHAHILKPIKGAFSYWANLLCIVRYEPWITGSAQPKLSKENLASIFLPSPPESEQQKIACFLDYKTRQIDQLIEKKKALIEKLDEQRIAVITQAVTKGIDENAKMKPSGIEWVGDIPEHWELKKLRFLGICQNGINIGAEYFGRGFPFVSYGDAYNNRELPVSASGLVESSENDREIFSVKRGDIFFTRTSETVEDIAMASVCMSDIEDAVFAGFLIRFRPNSGELNEEFSKYFFQNALLRAFFVKEMNLVTRASMSQGLLQNLPVLIPPHSEQKEIAEYLDTETHRLSQLTHKMQEAITRLNEYRSALITATVTGKIDVRQAKISKGF